MSCCNPKIIVLGGGANAVSINSIDFQPTGNPDEFTVVLTWTDENGAIQTTTDATPVTLTGGNIYTQDGALAGLRTVDMAGNDIIWQNGGDFIIDGKLTVTGLIDPTGVQFTDNVNQPDASMPNTTIFVTDGSLSGIPAGEIIFKDGTGDYHRLENVDEKPWDDILTGNAAYDVTTYAGDKEKLVIYCDSGTPQTVTGLTGNDIILQPNESLIVHLNDGSWWAKEETTPNTMEIECYIDPALADNSNTATAVAIEGLGSGASPQTGTFDGGTVTATASSGNIQPLSFNAFAQNYLNTASLPEGFNSSDPGALLSMSVAGNSQANPLWIFMNSAPGGSFTTNTPGDFTGNVIGGTFDGTTFTVDGSNIMGVLAELTASTGNVVTGITAPAAGLRIGLMSDYDPAIGEVNVVTLEDGTQKAWDVASDTPIDISGGIPATWVPCPEDEFTVELSENPGQTAVLSSGDGKIYAMPVTEVECFRRPASSAPFDSVDLTAGTGAGLEDISAGPYQTWTADYTGSITSVMVDMVAFFPGGDVRVRLFSGTNGTAGTLVANSSTVNLTTFGIQTFTFAGAPVSENSSYSLVFELVSGAGINVVKTSDAYAGGAFSAGDQAKFSVSGIEDIPEADFEVLTYSDGTVTKRIASEKGVPTDIQDVTVVFPPTWTPCPESAGLVETITLVSSILHDGQGSIPPGYTDNGSGVGTLMANGNKIISVEGVFSASNAGNYVLNHDIARVVPSVSVYRDDNGVGQFNNVQINSPTQFTVTGIVSSLDTRFKFVF